MKKLICIGEALIDFIPIEKGLSLKDTPSFEKACGGAPANVCASCAKLGENAILLTKLGNDSFGDFIVETLANVGVNTTYIKRSSEYETSLAFASLTKSGERSFAFYRKNAADLFFDKEDLAVELFDSQSILHFCSVDLVPSKMKDAHIEAIKMMREKGGIISFDPNLRIPLWSDASLLKKTVLEFIDYADIIKISDDEIRFLFDTEDIDAVKVFLFKKGVKRFIYSKGKDGVILFTPSAKYEVNGYNVSTIDTTGAGDSLIGAILTELLQKNISKDKLLVLKDEEYNSILDFANLYAAHTTTKKGAIPALANKKEIMQFKKYVNKSK